MAKKSKKTQPISTEKQDTDFKPSNKPYYAYDGMLLNAEVAWSAVITELIEHGLKPKRIANYAQCSAEVISDVLNNNYDSLRFRTGARILTLHERTFPNLYPNPML